MTGGQESGVGSQLAMGLTAPLGVGRRALGVGRSMLDVRCWCLAEASELSSTACRNIRVHSCDSWTHTIEFRTIAPA